MSPKPKSGFDFSTEAFAPEERFERYHDLYSAGADAVALDAAEPISAEITARPMEGLVLFERRLVGLGSERLAPRVRKNQFDHFTLQLNLAGEFHGEGKDGFHAVRPGDILLLDMGRPMRTRMVDAHLVALSISRAALLSAALPLDRMHGLVVPAVHAVPLAELLGGLIHGGNTPDIDAEIAAHLRLALQSMSLVEPDEPGDNEVERMQAAMRYIREHLWDEALSPLQIARAAGISRATLYRLFEEAGGVRRFIQAQRLARLRSGLTDPTDMRSVTELMYDAGFGSDAHASRSFRKAFGIAPSTFRREMTAAALSEFGGRAGDIKQRLAKWISDLS